MSDFEIIKKARNEALEEAAKLCDAEEALRQANMDLCVNGSLNWGPDPRASMMTQGHKAITAMFLAQDIRKLKEK